MKLGFYVFEVVMSSILERVQLQSTLVVRVQKEGCGLRSLWGVHSCLGFTLGTPDFVSNVLCRASDI